MSMLIKLVNVVHAVVGLTRIIVIMIRIATSVIVVITFLMMIELVQ